MNSNRLRFVHPRRKYFWYHLIGMLATPILMFWLFSSTQRSLIIPALLLANLGFWLWLFLNSMTTSYDYQFQDGVLTVTHRFWGFRKVRKFPVSDLDEAGRYVMAGDFDHVPDKYRFWIPSEPGFFPVGSGPLIMVRIRHKGGVFHTAMKLDPDQQDRVVEWLNARIFNQ